MSEEDEQKDEVLGNLSGEQLIAEIQRLQSENQRLRESLKYDALTGLVKTTDEGRIYILWKLEQARRLGKDITLVRLDINRLREKNKRLGHEEVNTLLPHFGRKLTELAGEEGIAMRFHFRGDEFGILLFGEKEEEINKKIEALERGFTIDNEDFTMSIGVATLTTHDVDNLKSGGEVWDKLGKEADIAERRMKNG